MSAYEDVQYLQCDGVAKIVINRPEVHNAFRRRTLEELTDAFATANRDQSVGVIVLTGAGDKAFCTGGDVNEEQHLTSSEGQAEFSTALQLASEMRNNGKPVIAAVKGYCIAGGNELNLICDLTIAADNAIFGHAGPRVGSVPVWYGTQLLPRLVGDKKAREIIYLCRQYTAHEAERMGWVNLVVPLAQFDAEVDSWCKQLLEKSPRALRIAKTSLNFGSDLLYPSLIHGSQMLSMVQGTDEFREGMTAFLQKKKPQFDRFRS